MLAGMGVAAGPRLAAAVTNAGGIGVIGGHGFTPEALRETISDLKALLHDKNAPFGVDLLIPKVGDGARKTKYVQIPNARLLEAPSRIEYELTCFSYDYTKGKLDELISIIIEGGAKLFVSAVGTPPKSVVDKLHANGVLYMNMVGHPKHVIKCLQNDVDIICAQGGEGGGHTGNVPTSILIPAIADLLKGTKSKFTGEEVQLVAAGGIYSGKSLAAALSFGAAGVWIGTRFIMAEEAGASKAHQEAVRTAGHGDTIRTIIFTVCSQSEVYISPEFGHCDLSDNKSTQGRPMRVRNNQYITNWEENRQAEIKELTGKGIRPVQNDADRFPDDDEVLDNLHPFLIGVAAAEVNKIKPAKAIVDELVGEAASRLQYLAGNLKSKL